MKRSSRLLLLLSATALFNTPSLASQSGSDDPYSDKPPSKSSVPNNKGGAAMLQDDDAQSSQKPAVGFQNLSKDLKQPIVFSPPINFNCELALIHRETRRGLNESPNSQFYYDALKNKATGAQNGDNGKSASQEEDDELITKAEKSKAFYEDFIETGYFTNFKEAIKLIPDDMVNEVYLAMRQKYREDSKKTQRIYWRCQGLCALPPFLYNMQKLTVLYCSNNTITYVPFRSLPPKLRSLYLAGNKLSGSLELNSPTLEILDLARNPKLTKVYIENLPNLEELRVDPDVEIVGDVSKIKVVRSKQLSTNN